MGSVFIGVGQQMAATVHILLYTAVNITLASRLVQRGGGALRGVSGLPLSQKVTISVQHFFIFYV